MENKYANEYTDKMVKELQSGRPLWLSMPRSQQELQKEPNFKRYGCITLADLLHFKL